MSKSAIDHSPSLGTSAREGVRQLGGEIAMLREELSGLVAELDRRRHEALDLKRQVKRHALRTALTATGLVAAGVTIVWLAAWRSHRREAIPSRWARTRRALSRMIDKRAPVAAEPSVASKIVPATVSAVMAILAKRALDGGLEVLRNRRRGPEPPRLERFESDHGQGGTHEVQARRL
jgi:hypothetical protein